MLQDQSGCGSTDLARVYAGLVDGSPGTSLLSSKIGAENLTGRRYSGGQTHEVLLPLGAATTVTPVWTIPLGAATTVTPKWFEPLGAATAVTPE